MQKNGAKLSDEIKMNSLTSSDRMRSDTAATTQTLCRLSVATVDASH